jgi:lipopolysaccharide transport system permease protein
MGILSEMYDSMIEAKNPQHALQPDIKGEHLCPPTGLSGTGELDVECVETVIRARSGWIPVDWRELYAYRELLLFLVWRDISARYKQTVLGSAWAVLQPLIMMSIFTFVARFMNLRTPMLGNVEIPYPVFVYAGLIPWTVFSQGMPQAALSLVNQQHMMTKVYFPRLFLPVASAAVFLVDLVYSLGIYALILVFYRIVPSWTCIFLPVLVLLTLIGTLSFGIILASLTLFYRDFRHVVPFLVQIMMYASPVFLPASMFTDKKPYVGWVLALNPMFGIIDAYRGVILGTPLNVPCFLISSVSALALFIFAIFYFRKTERKFADFA